MSTVVEERPCLDALNKLKSTDPPVFLSPSSDLSLTSRLSSKFLFASLKPYTPKSPFDQLLTDGFDAEQIWQQIDIQSQPLISSLKRDIRRFEKNPDQISSVFGRVEVDGGLEREIEEDLDVGLEEDSEEFEGLSDGDETEEEQDDDAGEEREMEEEEDDDDDDVSEGEGVPEVEDEFLKIKELEKYLAREEKREYGSDEKKNKKKGKTATKAIRENDEEDADEEDDDEGEADDDLLMYGGGGGDDEEDGGADIRYEDFFVPGKKIPKQKQEQADQSDESGDSEAEDEDDEHKKGNLSTYEKACQKIKANIKEMEEANLGEKDWTMQGEVTAAKRPKDSALEVDLDFDQNVRPPPVITEEVTASLEDIIKKRILEGNFNDVKKAPKLSSKAPKEFKELDDKKSKKGLAELYEEDYAQQTGLVDVPMSPNNKLGAEASKLFKAICLKLDALSHFHFAPKPVVEDMSVQANVPALAMEEIAPMAVSDAAMLAPEEIFSGKGDIKEDTELTQEERKRRRAKKKRKIKAAKARKTSERASAKKMKTNDEEKEQ